MPSLLKYLYTQLSVGLRNVQQSFTLSPPGIKACTVFIGNMCCNGDAFYHSNGRSNQAKKSNGVRWPRVLCLIHYVPRSRWVRVLHREWATLGSEGTCRYLEVLPLYSPVFPPHDLECLPGCCHWPRWKTRCRHSASTAWGFHEILLIGIHLLITPNTALLGICQWC